MISKNTIKKIFLISFLFLVVSGTVVLPTTYAVVGDTPPAPPSSPTKILNPLKDEFSTVPEFIEQILSVFINIALPLLVFFIVYAGYLFVRAQGNPTKLDEAKQAILWTMVGAAIVLGAYVIANAIKGTVDNLQASIFINTAYAADGQTVVGCDTSRPANVKAIIDLGTCIISKGLVQVVVLLLIIAFLYGVWKYVQASSEGNETAAKEAKEILGWGVVAMFIAFSIWGIILIIQNTFFGGQPSNTVPVPKAALPTGLATAPLVYPTA